MSITLVQKDSRGRVTLGNALSDRQYIVNVESNGTVVLEPAVIMSLHDHELQSQPEILKQVQAGIADRSSFIPGRPERTK